MVLRLECHLAALGIEKVGTVDQTSMLGEAECPVWSQTGGLPGRLSLQDDMPFVAWCRIVLNVQEALEDLGKL